MRDHYDLLVIGGGINGAGIARDATGRGLSVLLCEKDDLASHTSSSSTKLVHGGLRYLEHYEFRLVREALIEREVLLRMAPHIIWPLRFVLPHDKGLRPAWLLRAGLFLYDNLGGRRLLPGTESVDLRKAPHRDILEDRLTRGFAYSDCWVEDSRLVVLSAMDARARGADIRTRTEVAALERSEHGWKAVLRDSEGKQEVAARAVVNAAGPWVDNVLSRAIPGKQHRNLRLVKGSHLIVPRLYEGEHAYIFQNGDGRVLFAVPYEYDYTLLGTTDERFEGDPNDIAISEREARYICDAMNEYLKVDISPSDAVSSYAGVRPLYEDNSSSDSTVTRDYVFELDREGGAPILSIFGGKITTFRKLAEHALERLAEVGLKGRSAWTSTAPLPGGAFAADGVARFRAELGERYPWFSEQGLTRLMRAYGTKVFDILGDADGPDALGHHFGGDLYETEVRYLREREFAVTAEDILWRRSKLGLHLTSDEQQSLADFLSS